MFLKRIRTSYFSKLLVWFLIIGLAPTTTLGIMVYNLTKIKLEENLVSAASKNSDSLSEGVDQLVEQCQSWAELLAVDSDVQSFLRTGSSADYYKTNNKLLLTTGGKRDDYAVHIIGTHNISASTSRPPKEYSYPANENWGIFREIALSDSSVIYSGSPTIKQEGDIILSVGHRITSGQQLLGYIIIDVNRSSIDRLLRENDNFEAYIIDGNYTLYSSYGIQHEGLGKSGFTRGIAEGKITLDEKNYILTRRYLKTSEFNSVLLTPTTQLEDSIKSIQELVIIITLLGLVVSCVAAYFVAKVLSKPINQMTVLFQQVESGNFEARADFKQQDEIAIMGRAFNHMTQKIKLLIKNIEKKQYHLRVAETKALQAQINPHFLYNTLELIKSAAKMNDTEMVSKITVKLGRLLRYLANNKSDTTSVQSELDFLNQYIDIQKMRHRDRLTFVSNIDESILNCTIPKLVLQPLVENAIIHGLENQLKSGVLELAGNRKGNYLVFEVIDNGVGIPPEKLTTIFLGNDDTSSSLGLTNVLRRAKLYGDDNCGITVESQLKQGTRIILTLNADIKSLEN